MPDHADIARSTCKTLIPRFESGCRLQPNLANVPAPLRATPSDPVIARALVVRVA